MVVQARIAATPEADDREIVAGLVHGMTVLQALQKKPRLTQAELSAATGLTRATARRSLLTLMSLGYVDIDGSHYRMTPKILEMASSYLNTSGGWIAVASPYLEILRNHVEENVSAVVLDRADVVYVASFAADTVMSINVRIGGRKPSGAGDKKAGGIRLFHRYAHFAQGAGHEHRVLALESAGQPARAIGQRRQKQRAIGDGLAAGRRDATRKWTIGRGDRVGGRKGIGHDAVVLGETDCRRNRVVKIRPLPALLPKP